MTHTRTQLIEALAKDLRANTAFQFFTSRDHAAHLADVLLALPGIAVIDLPEVAHKGPGCTDAKFFRQVADRMDDPTRRIDYLSGSNVRNAVRELLYRAADAAETSR